jgi:Flp pilus assembly pilin Flp
MLSVLVTWIKSYLPQSEQGQDLIEYAMLGGLIALAIIGVGILALTGALNDLFGGIGNCVDFDSTTTCDPF